MRVMRLLTALVLSAAIPAAAEDLTIVSKVSSPAGGSTSTQYFSSGKFRSASGERDSIFDAAGGKMTMIDNKKKEYWETTLEEMTAMMNAAAEQLKQVQEQMKGNPMAAQMLEKMGGGAGSAAVEVQKGKEPRKIAGYDCEQFIVSMGSQIKMEIWATPAITPPTGFWDTRQALMATNPMTQRWGKLFDELKKIKGFTLAETTTMSFMGKNTQTSTEATEVKKGPIPASAFEVPAGYKKVESPMKDAMGKTKGRPRG